MSPDIVELQVDRGVRYVPHSLDVMLSPLDLPWGYEVPDSKFRHR